MYNRLFNTPVERMNDFKTLWNDKTPHGDLHLNEVPELVKYITESGYLTAPASTKYHGAWDGGLYEHHRAVFLRLMDLTEKLDLQWMRPESPFIVCMFHDVCKCDLYSKKPQNEMELPNGQKIAIDDGEPPYQFNDQTLLKGHGSKSVEILSTLIRLTEEEMLCIRYHMGPYEKEEWAEFDKAIRKYPNVLYTHLADMLASKVDDI